MSKETHTYKLDVGFRKMLCFFTPTSKNRFLKYKGITQYSGQIGNGRQYAHCVWLKLEPSRATKLFNALWLPLCNIPLEWLGWEWLKWRNQEYYIKTNWILYSKKQFKVGCLFQAWPTVKPEELDTRHSDKSSTGTWKSMRNCNVYYKYDNKPALMLTVDKCLLSQEATLLSISSFTQQAITVFNSVCLYYISCWPVSVPKTLGTKLALDKQSNRNFSLH